MQDTKKVVPLLAKLKPSDQTEPFLAHYQKGQDRVVIFDSRRAMFSKDFSRPVVQKYATSDFYYTLNIVREGFGRIKPTKADISGLHAWAADLDPKTGNELEPDPEIFRRYGLEFLLKGKTKLVREQAYILQNTVHPVMKGERGVPASVVVFSGRGIQLIWYADLVYNADAETIEQWESIGRALIATVGGDSVHNIDRLLRLPGTLNTKTRTLARIVWETDSRFTPTEMVTAFGKAPVNVQDNSKGVDPAEFKYVDWDRVFGITEIMDLEDELIEKFELDRKRYKDLNSLYEGEPALTMRDTSGSGFDVVLIGKLKRLGYDPQEAFEIAMTYDYGSGHKHAANNEPRHFMRCWSRSAGEKPTSAAEDFADVPAEKVNRSLTERSATRAEAEMVKEYLYVSNADKVIHMPSNNYLPTQGFNNKYITTHTGRKDMPEIAIKTLIGRGGQVDRVTWDPLKDPIFWEYGQAIYNVYRRKPAPNVNYTKGCTKPYHDVLNWVIPKREQAKLLLDHMAFTVQFPHIKINHHPVLYSITEGVGKDTLLSIIRHAIGKYNCSETTLKEMIGNFNTTLKYKKVVIINELQSFEKGKEVTNNLKPLLAAPPNTIEINVKYEPQFDQPNLFSLYMTSNSPRPLHVAGVDRRMDPMHCREERMPDEMAFKIWNWLKNEGGLDLMHHELLHRDVSHFNPNARPNTAEIMSDHREMQQQSKSNSEITIEEYINMGEDVFDKDIVLRKDLLEFAERKRMTISTVEVVLRDLGAVYIDKASVRLRKGPGGVRKFSMWVVNNKEAYVYGEGAAFESVGKKRNSVSYHDMYAIATGITDFDGVEEEEDIL